MEFIHFYIVNESKTKIVWNKFYRGHSSVFVIVIEMKTILRTFLGHTGTVYRNVCARSSHSIDKCGLEICFRQKLGVFFLFYFFNSHIFEYSNWFFFLVERIFKSYPFADHLPHICPTPHIVSHFHLLFRLKRSLIA